MSEIVTSSRLDWTIARFTRPTDGPSKGSVRAGFFGRDKIGATITRADIANFLLSQVDDQRFIRAAPAIIKRNLQPRKKPRFRGLFL
jgi:hypothetical protein